MHEIYDAWIDFVNGDDDAYEVIYSTFADSLFSYGTVFTSDTELVKDCIQDVFVNIYRKRDPSFIPGNIRLYLLAALKNSLLNALTRSSRQTNYDTSRMEQSVDIKPVATVEEVYIRSESNANRKARVENLLSVLTPRQKEIIYYRFVQGLDLGEICSLMDMNYQSAQNLIQRSLKKIRNSYGPQAVPGKAYD